MIKTKLIIILLFFLLGCGTMFDEDKNSSSKEKITIPKEVSIEIPEILKKDDKNKKNSNKKRFLKVTKKPISRGYMQLKNSIESVEETQELLNINLLLAEQVIDNIVTLCKETAISTTCKIDSGEVLFVFNDKFITDVRKILGEDDYEIEEERDKVYPLGKIEFTQYNQDEIYQYDLVMDITLISATTDNNDTTIQIIRWSSNEKQVFSSTTIKENSISIDYLKKNNAEKQMVINNKYYEKQSDLIGNLYLKIIERGDENQTFDINSIYNNNIEKSSSIGEISNQGGFLSIAGDYDSELYKEHYLFNNNGEIISSRYCDNSLICDLDDNNTWIDMFTEIRLGGTGGDIKDDAYYLLFHPNTNIEAFSLDTKEDVEYIIGSIIGELFIFENSIYGTLLDNTYTNQLDKILIVQFDSENIKNPFIFLTKKERPTLYLY